MAKKSVLRGKVVAHNISPKGEIEGVLLEVPEGVVQLNFPKHADTLVARAKIGTTLELPAELEDDEDGDHPVYLASDAAGEAAGRVVRFNYARHGEINGYQLDDGTFIHTKPDGAKRFKIHVGDRITAEGSRRTGSAAVVVEAKRVKKT